MSLHSRFESSPLKQSILLFAVAVSMAHAEDQTVKGILIDKDCSYVAQSRVVPGSRLAGGIIEAYTHTKNCLLVPACQRSGYGVFTYDTNQYLAFDTAGNAKALEAIKASKKEDDFRVEVTGEIRGNKIDVTSLKLE